MRHSLIRGLKKWKRDSYFQFVPVLTGGGADLMQMAPSSAAGVVLDFLAPSRWKDELELVKAPGNTGSVGTALTVSDISDPIDNTDPSVESRIFYVNGDLDMIIEVRNYNEGVSIKDMPSKEFLQRIAGAIDLPGVTEGGTTVKTLPEDF